MFGYVRAIPSVLPPEEAQRYEGVYCGLCRVLGDRYGWQARFILNYDFVFLAMLLAPQEEKEPFPTCPCPVHPWKQKACWPRNPALETAADACVILTWWKVQDARRDGGLGEKIGARGASLALKKAYGKAAALRPDFDRLVASCLEELHGLEEENVPSLDRPADTFARLLQGAGGELPPGAQRSAAEQILYHVGRWIYLADAWDDLESDRKTGSYNPLLAKFGPEAEGQKNRLRETMEVSLGLADTAFSLLDWGGWEDLLAHILRTGLPAVEEAVFSGQWKALKRGKKPKSTIDLVPPGTSE